MLRILPKISGLATGFLAANVAIIALWSSVGFSDSADALTSSSSFTGRICIDADCESAGSGKELVAKIGGVECATTTIFAISDGPSQTRYDISVPPESEVPGCGTNLAIVEFFVDGRPASVGGGWSAGQTQDIDTWVGEDFAAFSGALSRNGQPIEVTGGGGFYVGPTVRAYIDGILCGEKQSVQGAPGQAHYSLLVIPSSRPGCEQNDATVSFTVDGIPADQTDRNIYGFLTRDLNVTVASTPTPSPTQFAHFSGTICADIDCGGFGLSGQSIRARIGGVECGAAQISVVVDGPSQGFYILSVPSTDLNQGCGTEGATVEFWLGDRKSKQTASFHVNTHQQLNLWFGEDFSAFSGGLSVGGQSITLTSASGPPLIKAFVNGNLCGEKQVSPPHVPPGFQISQYSLLLVLSDESRAGCGTEGATVTFTINGFPATARGVWRAGFQTLYLEALPPLPVTGGPPSAEDGRFPAALAAGVIALAAGATVIAAARRRCGRRAN